ncbi:MAG: DNA polymerase II [Spirochaetales bacterium]|nr:DNA polymerase II [Spirochaetales bacterium]
MKGFLLTHEYRDQNGKAQIRLYGVGEEGPFLIIIDNQRPLFFVKRQTVLPKNIRAERKPVQLETFLRQPVDCLYFSTKSDFFSGRDLLKEEGVSLYESDVTLPERFLMERFIRGGVEIEGEGHVRTGRNGHGELTVYTNPVLRPSNYKPEFRFLSLDIETGQKGELYSIAVQGTGRHINRDTHPDGETRCFMVDEEHDERRILSEFLDWFGSFDPDIIIGWHVIGFDLMFLEKKCQEHRVNFSLGRQGETPFLSEKRSGIYSAILPGRLVIDGPPTLRSAFYKFENYTLETVAHELLGRGKDIRPDTDKVAEIERRFREDKEALARYNLEDCVLVTEIFEKTAIIDQLVTRSLISGMVLDRISLSVASFDFFYLPRLHRKGMVAPDTSDISSGEHAAGGHVFASHAGAYHNVAVLDFKSLYPSIIRTFHIDPWSRLNGSTDPLKTPNGLEFSRSEAILPDFLAELMEVRAQAKRDGDSHLSQAVKILMNSFYGVMGTTGCRFYHADLPTAITGTGQWILKESSAYLRAKGYDVIYGDTDSLFVCLPEHLPLSHEDEAARLTKEINLRWKERLEKEFGLTSYLELEWEKLYTHFLIPPIRGTKEGATKRYAGRKTNGEVELKGLEFVRSDWTALAKRFQFELFERFFRLLDREVNGTDEEARHELREWVRRFTEDLKEGRFDGELIYKRRLTKKSEGYTKNTPPHVKAIRMLDEAGIVHGRDVEYYMTPAGPVPVQLDPKELDYNHYLEKQIRPLADGVLFALGLSFDGIIDGEQLDLFG